jgi:hypothetical protein
LFPEFAKVYEWRNFVQYAETTELIVNIANDQLLTWRNHLRNEGGFAPIRVDHPYTNETMAKPCILLPSAALANWKTSFNEKATNLVRTHLQKWDPQRYNDPKELEKLFYLQRIGIYNPSRKFYWRRPVWKMDIMLKKWRTDRALEHWGNIHQVRRDNENTMFQRHGNRDYKYD